MAALACAGGDSKAGLGPNEDVATVLSVTSAVPTIDVGQVVVLRAAGRTAGGQTAPVSVTWTANGGSVVPVSDSEAQFSASTAGTHWVYARGTVSPFPEDSTAITVVAPVSPTVIVSVLPGSVSVSAGGAQQFSVSATRQDGTTYTPSVLWTATGGSIFSNGFYTAGGAAGTFLVIAIQQGGTLADTSIVTVAPFGGGLTEPTPAGTVIFDGRAGGAQSFQSVGSLNEVNQFFSANGGVGLEDGWAFTTNYDGTGKHALRIDWPAAPSSESGATGTYYYPSSYSHVYMTVVIHLGRTLTGGGVGMIGSFIPVTNAGGMKRFMWLRQRDNGTDRIYWVWPAGEQPSGQKLSIDNRSFDSSWNAVYPIGVDTRYTIEIKSGSPGTLRVWQDGVLVHNDTNANIGTLPFAESQLSTVRFGGQQLESEYWTDLVLWTP